MKRKMSVKWHLREVMAVNGMYQTTDLVPLLADRGVVLSREQVFRLVTQAPQRLSLDTLAALCDILSCGPQDLIEVVVENKTVKKAVGAERSSPPVTPVRARVVKKPR